MPSGDLEEEEVETREEGGERKRRRHKGQIKKVMDRGCREERRIGRGRKKRGEARKRSREKKEK